MNSLIILLTGIIGVTATYYVSVPLQQGSVRASAVLSLVVAVFFYVFPSLLNPFLTENIPLVFFGASFIGMVSSKVNVNYFLLTIAGSLFSVIYINKSEFYDGFGGGLGAVALISLLTTLGFSVAFSKESKLAKLISSQSAKLFKKSN